MARISPRRGALISGIMLIGSWLCQDYLGAQALDTVQEIAAVESSLDWLRLSTDISLVRDDLAWMRQIVRRSGPFQDNDFPPHSNMFEGDFESYSTQDRHRILKLALRASIESSSERAFLSAQRMGDGKRVLGPYIDDDGMKALNELVGHYSNLHFELTQLNSSSVEFGPDSLKELDEISMKFWDLQYTSNSQEQLLQENLRQVTNGVIVNLKARKDRAKQLASFFQVIALLTFVSGSSIALMSNSRKDVNEDRAIENSSV